MIRWLQLLFARGDASLSNEFHDAAGEYVQLVKSRILEALVTDNARLAPSGAASAALLAPLCAYFAARTDYELELRGVAQKLRDEIWPQVIDTVFEEMEIDGQAATVTRTLVLGQMGLVRGVIETKGPEDSAVLGKLLEVLALRDLKEAPAAPGAKVDYGRLAAMLAQYQGYLRYLDVIAKEGRAHA